MKNFVRVLSSGGRLIGIESPHGDCEIEILHDHDGPIYDSGGKLLGSAIMVMKEPPPPLPKVLTDQQKQRMASRRAVCEGCDKSKGFTQVGVKCSKCKRCQNNLSLIGESSACPLDKWGMIGG